MTGQDFLSTVADAKKYIDGLARRMALPKGWERISFDYFKDNTPGRGDSDRCGRVYAGYCPRIAGYHFLDFGPK
jgi:hypothetical protein